MVTEYFFLIIILLLPFQFALNVGDSFDLVTTRILALLLFLFWLVRGMIRRKIEIPNQSETWLIVIFLFLSALSLFLGRDGEFGIRKLIYFFSIAPVFFVAVDVFREEKWSRLAQETILASGFLAAGLAIFQFALPLFLGIGKAVKIWEDLAPYFLGHSFGGLVAGNSSWLVNIGGKTVMRAFGFFPDPHNFAFFSNLCFFMGLGYVFQVKKNKSRLVILVSLFLLLISIGLSFSRGSYLGWIAGFLFFGVVFLKKSGLLGKTLGIFLFIILSFSIYNSSFISQRLGSSFNTREGSNAERLKNWEQAVEIIKDYPVGGVGLGNYARTVDPMAGERSSIYAHNLFLDIAAETGILNAFVFLILIVVAIWRNLKNGDMLSLGIASGLVGFSVHSIFDTAPYSPQVLTMLLVLMALGINDSLKLKVQS